MTYASATRRPNPAALVGALGVPGAFGALLVVGLAVTVTTLPKPPNPAATPIADMPLPPPPPTPDKPQPDAKAPSDPAPVPLPIPIPLPPPPGPLPVDLGKGDPLTLQGAGDLGGVGGGTATLPQPSPSASPFDPVAARPKGNAGKWVTNDDYRPRWVMEGLAGRAGFTLSIDASGKVTGCTITRSTGHAPLDAATCDLVAKRARFDAARDGSGKPVAGTYRGAVTWQLPD